MEVPQYAQRALNAFAPPKYTFGLPANLRSQHGQLPFSRMVVATNVTTNRGNTRTIINSGVRVATTTEQDKNVRAKRTQ